MTLKREPLLKPRGRPFKPGNPGRPPGARNKATQAIEQLAEGHAESLGEKSDGVSAGWRRDLSTHDARSGLPDTQRPAGKRRHAAD